MTGTALGQRQRGARLASSGATVRPIISSTTTFIQDTHNKKFADRRTWHGHGEGRPCWSARSRRGLETLSNCSSTTTPPQHEHADGADDKIIKGAGRMGTRRRSRRTSPPQHEHQLADGDPAQQPLHPRHGAGRVGSTTTSQRFTVSDPGRSRFSSSRPGRTRSPVRGDRVYTILDSSVSQRGRPIERACSPSGSRHPGARRGAEAFESPRTSLKVEHV